MTLFGSRIDFHLSLPPSVLGRFHPNTSFAVDHMLRTTVRAGGKAGVKPRATRDDPPFCANSSVFRRALPSVVQSDACRARLRARAPERRTSGSGIVFIGGPPGSRSRPLEIQSPGQRGGR